MIITFFSVAMSVLWGSFLMILFSILRKKYKLLDICSVSGIVILYVFCIMRLLVPIEVPWVHVIESKHVYNALYTFIRQEIGGTQICVWQALTGIWIGGVVIILLLLIHRYHSYGKRVKKHCEKGKELDLAQYGLKDNSVKLIQTDEVNEPASFGIFRKFILIPSKSYTDRELELIVAHEYMHLRNGDPIVQLLVNILCAAYWWNPFVYLLRKDLVQYFEIRCDAAVTEGMTKNEVVDYLEVILKIYKGSGIGSGERLKDRFEILDKRAGKHERYIGKAAAVIISLFILALSYSFIIQSSYAAPMEDITEKGCISVEQDNSYLIRHSNGRYSIHCGDDEADINSDAAEMMIKEGFTVYDEE